MTLSSATFCRMLVAGETEALTIFGQTPLPKPAQWARDRVDEICGGQLVTDTMPYVAFVRLAAYVERVEGSGHA